MKRLPAHLPLALGAAFLVASSWAVGMKAGYGYAKQDAARVLQMGLANESPAIPSWRAWADSNVDYEAPRDLALLFGITGYPLPGTGGMTTADVWNGYQRRVEREYFERGIGLHRGEEHGSVPTSGEPSAQGEPTEYALPDGPDAALAE